MLRPTISLLVCILLASCGGGGGSAPSSPVNGGNSGGSSGGTTPADPNYGLWIGTSSAGADFTVLLTEDELYAVSYSLYQVGKPEELMVTSYERSGDSITAEDAIYYSLSSGSGVVDIEITGVTGTTASGSISDSSGTVTFTASYDGVTAIGSQNLDKVVGLSRGLSIGSYGVRQSVVEVNSEGQMRGYSSTGCLVTGALQETTNSRHFSFSASVANGLCETPNGTPFSGAAIYNESTNLLYLLARSSDNSSGLAFWGDMTRATTQQALNEVGRGNGNNLAEGLWLGYTGDDRIAVSVVSEGGDGYVFYTNTAQTEWAGVGVTRLENSSAGVLSSFARDFSWEFSDIFDLTISGSVSGDRFTGNLDYGINGANSFDLTYDDVYEDTADIANLVGSYSGIGGSGFGQEGVQFVINEEGRYAGISEYGCEANGYLAPRSRGNIFDVSISFGPEPCTYANQTLMGNALYHPELNYLFMAAPEPTFTGGIAVIASKIE